MDDDWTRRSFLSTTAQSALLGAGILGGLSRLPRVSAAEAKLNPAMVLRSLANALLEHGSTNPAVQAGREAYELGLPEPLDHASATSPLTGFLG